MELSQAVISILMLGLSTVVSGLVGFLIYLFRRTSENERAIMQHRLDSAEKYAHKNEIEALGSRLERKIDELFKQLYEGKK